MKKMKFILSALTLLVACATAHAQVFDVSITPSDGSDVFSQTNATCIEIQPGNPWPISVFSGESDLQGTSLTVTHGVRYDFALTPATTIKQGTDGNLPSGNFMAHAPKYIAAAQTSVEPVLKGPALVLMREEGDPIIYYAMDATDGPIKLKINPNGEYIVGATVVKGVTNVYYEDPHMPEAHAAVDATCTKAGNTAYWSCSVCHKYFSDEAGSNEIEENSWETTPAVGHVDADYNGFCDRDNEEMDVTVALSKVGDRYYTSFSAPYIYKVTNAGDDLRVYVATSLSDDVLTMTQVGDAAIAAGKGVVIVGTSSSSPETMTATIAHATEAEIGDELLRATTQGMKTTGKAFFSAVNGIVGFYAYNSTLGAVPAGKAYVNVADDEDLDSDEDLGPNYAPMLRLAFNDESSNKPDITVTKINTLGVIENVGFKVKDDNDWLMVDSDRKLKSTSSDTPVQGAIGEKNYSGFFFSTKGSDTWNTTGISYYEISYALPDINDPANGIIVDKKTPGGSLLAPRYAPAAEDPKYFVIKGNNDLYVLVYNGKVYGTADIEKATKFEAYKLEYADHAGVKVQDKKLATCTEDGHNAVYQCSICEKHFKEKACINETAVDMEVIEALGHDYHVVKDDMGKATWTWDEDKSSATLHVICANDLFHTDDQTIATTSEVTTVPTEKAEGLQTYIAKVTYNEVEYTSTKTATIEKLVAESPTPVTGDITPENNSVTVINESNIVAAGEEAPTITVNGTANIILTGEATNANVNLNVPAGATLNIYGSENATISGTIEASGTVTLSNTVITSESGKALKLTDGSEIILNGYSRIEGVEKALDLSALTSGSASSIIKAGPGMQLYTRNTAISSTSRRNAPGLSTLSSAKIILTCDPEDSHPDANFTGVTLSDAPDAAGLYNHVCDRGCGTVKSGFKIIKDFTPDKNLELAYNGADYSVTNLTLNDGTGYENINIPVPFSISALNYTRQFNIDEVNSNDVMNTVVLPFDIPEGSTINAKFCKLSSVQLNSSNNLWEIHFQLVYDKDYIHDGTPQPLMPKLNAHTPYLVIPSSKNMTFAFNGLATAKSTSGANTKATYTNPEKNDRWTFEGAYTYHKWDESELGRIYAIAGTDKAGVSAGEFVRLTNGASIYPMRAILTHEQMTVPSPKPGRIVSLYEQEIPETIEVIIDYPDENPGEGTLSIGTLNTRTGEFKPAADHWYDLRGRKLNRKPTAKGSYYNKKVLVK